MDFYNLLAICWTTTDDRPLTTDYRPPNLYGGPSVAALE
jgi:hypothetical protein